MRTFKSAALNTCLSLTMLLSTTVGWVPARAQEIVWRSYQELAQNHLKSGNLDMAERLSLEAVDVAEKIPPHEGVLVESLKLLADIYQAEKKQFDYEKTLKRIAAAEKKDAEKTATTVEPAKPVASPDKTEAPAPGATAADATAADATAADATAADATAADATAGDATAGDATAADATAADATAADATAASATAANATAAAREADAAIDETAAAARTPAATKHGQKTADATDAEATEPNSTMSAHKSETPAAEKENATVEPVLTEPVLTEPVSTDEIDGAASKTIGAPVEAPNSSSVSEHANVPGNSPDIDRPTQP